MRGGVVIGPSSKFIITPWQCAESMGGRSVAGEDVHDSMVDAVGDVMVDVIVDSSGDASQDAS